tara:strand:- start:1032 stop:1715 length:684 start_codon:yes stop_codon:yes gene_type:complete
MKISASSFSKQQISDLNSYFKDFLLKNPEIIESSLIALQEKKISSQKESQAKALKDKKDLIFQNSNDPVLGNVNGSDHIVVFLDPFCGHCRAFKKTLSEAMERNQDLKVTIKDFPILGSVALLGSKAMLAAHKQGFYAQMQDMIYKAPPTLNEKEIFQFAKTIPGLNLERFKQDFKSDSLKNQIMATFKLAESLGISATPTLIIHDEVIEGGIPLEVLEKTIKKESL